MALSPTAADLLREQVRAKHGLPEPVKRRAIREAAGVTAGHLAATLGVSRQTLHNYENGIREPRGELLIRYAQALKIMKGARSA